MHDAVRPGFRAARQRSSSGLACAPAYFVPLAVCGVAGRSGSMARLAAEVGVLALVVAVVGFEATAPAGLIAVGSSALSVNGFAVHGFGELGWYPSVDLPVAVILLCVWALAWSAREGVPVAGRSRHRVPVCAGRNLRGR